MNRSPGGPGGGAAQDFSGGEGVVGFFAVPEQRLKNASFPVVVGPGQRFIVFCYSGSGSNQRLNRFCAILTKVEFIGHRKIIQVPCKGMRVVGNLYGEVSEGVVSAFLLPLAMVIPDSPDNLTILGPVGRSCLG